MGSVFQPPHAGSKTAILCKLSVVFMSIDLHSEKPCFSVEFVDRYFMKLGVEELGVFEVGSGGVGSGGS